MYRPFIFVALLLGALTQTVKGQGILNGSFESPNIPGLLGVPNIAYDNGSIIGSTVIPNWNVSSGVVTLVNPGIGGIVGLLASDTGSQYVVLDQLSVGAGNILSASAPATLSQSFTTTPGDIYTIKYAYSGIGLNLLGATSALGVNVSGFNPYSATNGLLSVSANGFQTTSFNFTATGATSVLTFNETAADVLNGGGIGLDSVSATDLGPAPVPEPAQSALLGVGLLLVLAALKHRFPSATSKSTPSPCLA